MAKVKFYYMGDAPTKVSVGKIASAKGKKDVPEFLDEARLTPSNDYNPLFNFDQKFIDDLQAISSVDLGQSVPYISLKAINRAGKVIQDYNMEFFNKAVDFSSLSTDTRYPERPTMSLKDVAIKTDNASGYLYYTTVIINLKIHKSDFLASTSLLSLMFPGMPLVLEYGWRNPSGGILDKTEQLLFAVKHYDINIDQTGQIDFKIEGMALNEKFNNTIVGDYGVTDDSSGQGTIATKDQIDKYFAFLEQEKKRTDAAAIDKTVISSMYLTYKKLQQRSEGLIKKNFQEAKNAAFDKKNIIRYNFTKKEDQTKCIHFHTLIYEFLNKTLEHFSDIYPSISEVRITYGNFNASAGTLFNGKSIATFPIPVGKVQSILKDYSADMGAPTVERFITDIISDVIENDEYWTSSLPVAPKGTDPDKLPIFHKPDIAALFYNKVIEKTQSGGNPSGERMLEIIFIDVNSGLPISTTLLNKKGATTQAEIEKNLRSQPGVNIPIIRLGHMGSFIKTVSMSQFSDSYMKAAYLEKMTKDRIYDPKKFLYPELIAENAAATALSLPLKGSAEVLGHIAWKPFRAFYLDAGNPLINAVYKITGVSHMISAEGFKSTLDFMYH